MKSEWWQNVLKQYDFSIMFLFVLVLSFVLNWEMNDDERMRRIMSIVALASCLVVLAFEVAT